MRIGINYDTGVFPGHHQSRPVFDPRQVAFDMNVIARELHCSAVRITGGNLERLTVAANCAARSGLEVWFSPHPCELEEGEMLALFKESAKIAETIRRSRANVVLVVGCEVSVFGRGFVPGVDAYERMRQLVAPSPELFASYPASVARLNAFVSQAVRMARSEFAGPLTYASGPWEQIDWTPFDMVGVDAYMDRSNNGTFDDDIGALMTHGKSVVVTEFGCCTYRGAGDRGASGWMILKGEGRNRQLDGDYVRDENEQVSYLRKLLGTFERHGVDISFWFTFASWNRPHRQDPAADLDLASFGVVKVIDDLVAVHQNCWKPKAVFNALASAARDSKHSQSEALIS